jgi:hypothetical protein
LPLAVKVGSALLELNQLKITNRGHKTELDTIDFALNEAKLSCLNRVMFEQVQIQATLVRDPPSIRITVSVDSWPISLERDQFSYLCDLLNLNFLAGAKDGLDLQLGTPLPVSKVATVSSIPWLSLSVSVYEIELLLPGVSSAKISSVELKIVKFFGPSLAINVNTGNVGLDMIGSAESIGVCLESITGVSRVISVTVTDPAVTVSLAKKFELRSFFFDPCPGYILDRYVVRASAPAAIHIDTSLTVELVNSRVILPAEKEANDFILSANSLTYYQGFQHPVLTRKLIVNGSALHFQDPQTDLVPTNLISENFNCLVASSSSGSAKLHFEPMEVRIGFSHIQELSHAVSNQLESVKSIRSAPHTTATPPTSRMTEFTFQSLSLLIVNDMAALQNTPLVNVVLKKFAFAEDRRVALGEGRTITRANSTLAVSAAVSMFNRTAVEWEPLIEGIVPSTSTTTNSAFVQLDLSRNWLEVFDGEIERSSQFALNQSEGIQLNVSEALIKLVYENLHAFSHRRTRTQTFHTKLAFSPYSVRNLTGGEITIQSDPNPSISVPNNSETFLTDLSLDAEPDRIDANPRVIVRVSGIEWTIPRVPIDKVGISFFSLGDGVELIGEVAVTGEGRKLITLQSQVLLENKFGQSITVKCGEEYSVLNDSIAGLPLFSESKSIKIQSANSEWTGSITLEEIWKHSDESGKLYQLNFPSQNYIYLSARRRRITFRGSSTDQLRITVVPPLRFRSTLACPVALTVRKETSHKPVGEVSSVVQAGKCVAVTELALSGGRVVVRLSLPGATPEMALVGSFQAWPVPSDTHEKSDGQRFHQVVLQRRSVPFSTMHLEVHIMSSPGQPPELLIHSPHWLVCVDLPSRVRFAYTEEDEETSWGGLLSSSRVNWVAGADNTRSERTFTLPLDSTGGSITAYWNDSKSSELTIDTVGATSSVSLDASGEGGRVLRQDFAVIVEAVSGRELPVKVTKIFPKFVCVNTTGTVVFVKQFSGGDMSVEIPDGTQTPFKWWQLNKGTKIAYSFQVATIDGIWSNPFSVTQIGEHRIEGIENLRAEIRIFKGGYFIVLAKHNPHIESPPGGVSPYTFRVVLPELAISVIGPRNGVRGELVHVNMRSVALSLSTGEPSYCDLVVESIQIDDMREVDITKLKFPVVMRRGAANASPALAVSAAWTKNNTVLEFDRTMIKLAPMELYIDYGLISSLTEIVVDAMRVRLGVDLSTNTAMVPAAPVLPVGSLRILSFREFLFEEVKITLSFSPTPTANSNFSIFHKAIACMASVERSPLRFAPLRLRGFRASRSNLASVVIEHFKHQLYLETKTLMGSAEAIGNPIGLINSVSIGVNDLIREPMADGAKSFLRNTTFGVFNSMSKLAATSAQTLSVLTEDPEYISDRTAFNRKNRPSHVGDGMMVGAASFGKGIIAGISGLVTKPVEGLEQEGIVGLARGTVKGVGGLFLKPVAGLFDFAKSTADGVVFATKDATMDVAVLRLPRMVYTHDRVVRVISSEHSLLRWYLALLEGCPADFSYCTHLYDTTGGQLVVVGSSHLIIADTQARRINLLVPHWRIVGVSPDWTALEITLMIQMPNSGLSPFKFAASSEETLRGIHRMIASSMEI